MLVINWPIDPQTPENLNILNDASSVLNTCIGISSFNSFFKFFWDSSVFLISPS